MKSRTVSVRGVTLFYCSRFLVYMMPARCKEERRIGRGEVRTRYTHRLRRRLDDSNTTEITEAESLDIDALIEQRRACLTCPGVCKRSKVEQAKGELE